MDLRRAVLLFIVFIIGAGALPAQITTGNIIGIVHDESRAVLPGVTVAVASPGLPAQSAVTNERGEYRLTGLQPGMYLLTVELPGFGERSFRNHGKRPGAGS